LSRSERSTALRRYAPPVYATTFAPAVGLRNTNPVSKGALIGSNRAENPYKRLATAACRMVLIRLFSMRAADAPAANREYGQAGTASLFCVRNPRSGPSARGGRVPLPVCGAWTSNATNRCADDGNEVQSLSLGEVRHTSA